MLLLHCLLCVLLLLLLLLLLILLMLLLLFLLNDWMAVAIDDWALDWLLGWLIDWNDLVFFDIGLGRNWVCILFLGNFFFCFYYLMNTDASTDRDTNAETGMQRYRCNLSWQCVFNIFTFTINYIRFNNYEHFVIVWAFYSYLLFFFFFCFAFALSIFRYIFIVAFLYGAVSCVYVFKYLHIA